MATPSRSNGTVRKFLISAALLSALVGASGATLVATAATSPALAQVADLTGSEEKQKIDELQHKIDPRHYPAPPKVDPKPDPAPEPGFVQRCINWVCSLFSDNEEQEKKEHDEALKKAVEERHRAEEAQKRLESPKTADALKTEALKTEAKRLETRTTAIKAVETLKPSTTNAMPVHAASAFKPETTRVGAFKASTMEKPIAAAAPKSLPVTALAHPLTALTLTSTARFSGFSVVKR
jgi:hypothetical protein